MIVVQIVRFDYLDGTTVANVVDSCVQSVVNGGWVATDGWKGASGPRPHLKGGFC